MSFTYIRHAAVALALIATAGCTVKSTEPPPLSGPSGLALTLNVSAIPDSISQDGGSQSSVKVTAIGPDGKLLSNVPIRVDMMVNGVPQDYGTLSARTVVTGSDGVASVVYTAPPSPPDGIFGTCNSLPGNCVSIVATATATNFETANPQQVLIRLVPTGVILPPTAAPTPSFVVTPSSPSANSPAQFDASTSCGTQLVSGSCPSSAPSITSYSWNFGDGQTGTGQTVSHSFALQQTYTVTLTVTNAQGASASKPQVITVGRGSGPTATFTFSPAQPGVGEQVFFSGSLSTAGEGHTIASYRWTFGDGASGSGSNVSHAYSTAGSYGVQLTVTDETGQSNTSSATSVTVGSPPAPTAAFTSSPTAPSVNQPVVFDASTSSTAQGQTIIDYAWNFGDGTPVVHGASRTIAHVFTISGTFQVNLVVTDSANRTGSKQSSVIVSGGAVDLTFPTAAFTATPQPALVNQEVSFDGSSSARGSTNSPIVTYTWNFGDGSPVFSSSVPTVGYTYRAKNNFTVTLTVTDANNKSSTTTKSVLVQ